MHACYSLDFSICSKSELHTINIEDRVFSVCQLHLSDTHVDTLIISYCTGGNCTVVPTEKCQFPTQMKMLNFELLVSRPNTININREANIYLFGVTKETHLQILCVARQTDRGEVLGEMDNILTVEFIMSSKL